MRNKLLGIALAGTMWVGSHGGCDVDSAYLREFIDYYPVASYISPYEVGYTSDCYCDSYGYDYGYDYYPGTYYYGY